MVSDFYPVVDLSLDCLGRKRHIVGNLWTRVVEVLIVNPNGAFISVQGVGGSVTHSSQYRYEYRWWITGRRALMNTTSHSGTAQMGVPHTHGAALLVLVRCSVVSVCSLPAVCCLPGTCLGCALVKGLNSGGHSTGTYVPGTK